MRKAYSDNCIITDEAGEEFIGISLGYDHCAEHEWGIKGIKRDFGLPEPDKKHMGIKSRIVTKIPDNLIFKKEGDYAFLFTGNRYGKDPEELPYELSSYKGDIKWSIRGNDSRDDDEKKDPIVTAWAEYGFGIVVKGKKESSWLEELYNQFKKKNVAITRMNIQPWNPFSNASLTLAIVDKIPTELTDAMYKADKSTYDLKDYCKKIGLTKLKEGKRGGYKENKYFMAVSPSWITAENKEELEKKKKNYNTKYDIIIWVNYSDDDDNYGWYTFEDIKKWLSTPGLKLTDISFMGSGHAPKKRD